MKIKYETDIQNFIKHFKRNELQNHIVVNLIRSHFRREAILLIINNLPIERY